MLPWSARADVTLTQGQLAPALPIALPYQAQGRLGPRRGRCLRCNALHRSSRDNCSPPGSSSRRAFASLAPSGALSASPQCPVRHWSPAAVTLVTGPDAVCLRYTHSCTPARQFLEHPDSHERRTGRSALKDLQRQADIDKRLVGDRDATTPLRRLLDVITILNSGDTMMSRGWLVHSASSIEHGEEKAKLRRGPTDDASVVAEPRGHRPVRTAAEMGHPQP